MRIKRLLVEETVPIEKTIQDIRFNLQGLNLILDETNSKKKTETGNSVGKTTAIRIIDLCLGAKSPKSLYEDSADTHAINKLVMDYIDNRKVRASLTVIDSEGKEHILIRHLHPRGRMFIDGKQYKKNDYLQTLNLLFFDNKNNSPSFRQLIKKFVRTDTAQLDNVIKYLHNSTTNMTYGEVYMFLLGFSNMESIDQITSLQSENSATKKFEKDLKSNLGVESSSELSILLDVLIKDSELLKDKRSKLDYQDELKSQYEKKRSLESQINEIDNQIGRLEFSISVSEKSIIQIKKDYSDIDTSYVKSLYNESEALIGKIDKTFSELLTFHNTMIANRSRFIQGSIEKKQKELQKLLSQQSDLITKKQDITIGLVDSQLMDDLKELNQKISDLDQKIGETQEAKKQLLNIENKAQSLKKQIENCQIDDDEVSRRVEDFNNSLGHYSNRLYDETYYLSYNKGWHTEGQFPFKLNSINGTSATGMKMGSIAIFDFAYLDYAKRNEIKCPDFIIHDRMETAHQNQMKTILEIASSLDGQYILPILKEKVKNTGVSSDFIEKSTVLSLSESRRFFKI